MITNLDFESEERKAGRKAATTLRNDFRSQIKKQFQSRTGALLKSKVTPRYRNGWLDRLVVSSPRYSFQKHFGSTKTGSQGATTRKEATVKGFQRHVKGQTIDVGSHTRAGGSVKSFSKNRKYKAHNHIALALRQTSALQTLATDLGNNRITVITSQINF